MRADHEASPSRGTGAYNKKQVVSKRPKEVNKTGKVRTTHMKSELMEKQE